MNAISNLQEQIVFQIRLLLMKAALMVDAIKTARFLQMEE